MRLANIALAALAAIGSLTIVAAASAQESPLRGTWTLVAADQIRPDGERVRDYGENPKGRLIVDAAGRYSLQIFKSERPRFVGPDKGNGTADEFKAAVMGSSTHFGTVTVDAKEGLLLFAIESASFPNWEGTVQKRKYKLEGRTLSYRVPPRPDGRIPVSVWRKLD
ncbi:lipocalin-like domain-containing protein [Luteimonas sp. SX5]|uniref:Lipocalin-like domain-containing protein n=1 Tax=Luteimonas galliterrae TaxID=2940486 RepID=A0ABT0MFH9_9GAMM|nr:lipocalin-like domain-containing protein [Luteimonas galliterrae]MCL1633632.1 lipocalin-like domain-containing protein [Luteimonas galliterrae]